MFEHKVPLFTPKRILSREILFSLRDLAYQEQVIRYTGYSDGVIAGCDLFEKAQTIGVKNGVVKFAGRLYQLESAISVPYEPTEQWRVLKVRFATQRETPDFAFYQGELVLDENTELAPNELELGRFKLKRGSRLRTKYVDFADMATEYDTVNLLHVRQAFPNEPTLHREITAHFAREAYPFLTDNALDIGFCGQCLASGQPVSRELVRLYLSARMKTDEPGMGSPELYRSLGRVLKAIKSGGALDGRKRADNHAIMLA